MSLGTQEIEQALGALGDLLQARREQLTIAVIGGSGMLLAGYSSRATQDVDAVGLVVDGAVVAAGSFPSPVAEAIADRSVATRRSQLWSLIEWTRSTSSSTRLPTLVLQASILLTCDCSIHLRPS